MPGTLPLDRIGSSPAADRSDIDQALGYHPSPGVHKSDAQRGLSVALPPGAWNTELFAGRISFRDGEEPTLIVRREN